MRRRLRVGRGAVIAMTVGLSTAAPAWRARDSNAEARTQLIRPLELVPTSRLRRPVIDETEGLSWRVEGASIHHPQAELRTVHHGLTLDVEALPRDGFVLLRSGPVGVTGEARVRLHDLERTLWEGTVELVPAEADLPETWAVHQRSLEAPDAAPTTVLDALAAGRPLVRARLARVLGRRSMFDNPSRAIEAWQAGLTARAFEQTPITAHRLLESIAFLQLYTGELAAGFRTLQRLETAARPVPDEARAEARAELWAMLESKQGRPQLSLRHLESAGALAHRLGDEAAIARTEQITGALLGALGRFEAAIGALEHALKAAEGYPAEYMARVNLSAARLRAAEAGVRPEPWSRLGRDFEETYEAVRGKRPPGILSWLAAQRADVALRDNDLTTAEAWLARIDDWRPKTLGSHEGYIRRVQAELSLRRGDIGRAETELSGLVKMLRERQPKGSLEEVAALLLLAETEPTTKTQDRRLEEAWARALSATRRLAATDAQSHRLALVRDLPARIVRARMRARAAEAAAEVALEGTRLLWAQLGATRRLALDPSRYREILRLRKEARQTSCGLLPAVTRPSCEITRAQWLAEADAIERSLLWSEDSNEVTKTWTLAELRAELPKTQAILLASRTPDHVVYFLVEQGKLSVQEGAIPQRWFTRLEALERLFVLGAVEPVDIETEAGPLATRVPIVRWAGPHFEAPTKREGTLVVADPRGDLPRTNKLGTMLVATLDAAGLIGPGATQDHVLAALGAAALDTFAFLGHGRVSDQSHWSTRLRLTDGDLDAYGLLMLPQTPRLVALVGCSTGRTPHGRGIGLPEVLVQRGAEAVLATVEAIDDGAGGPFVETFLREAKAASPAVAYQRACAAAHASGDPTWRSFSLWQGFPSR